MASVLLLLAATLTTATVDRVEGDIAVVELRSGQLLDVPARCLVGELVEGGTVTFTSCTAE